VCVIYLIVGIKPKRRFIMTHEAKLKLLKCVDNHKNDDECWIWTGQKDKYGYGKLEAEGKDWKTHRLSYAFFVGKLKKGLVVIHTCDNPICFNPNHLKQTTQKNNIYDCISKGRRGKLGRKFSFTKEEANEIRDASKFYTRKELSILYKTTVTTIYNILHRIGENYK
jgi:hypothetical protein